MRPAGLSFLLLALHHTALHRTETPMLAGELLRMRRETAASAHLFILAMHVDLWTLGTSGERVTMNEDIIVFTEIRVEVLESAAGGFRVEEVDDGDEGEVEDAPDDVEFPAEVLDADLGDLDHHEVEDPVGGGAERGAFLAHGERVDLGRVQPRHALEADAEEDVVQEEEGDAGGGDLGFVRVGVEIVEAQ
nr:hypothetical protein CFP56_71954 [Quercus suber]